MCYIGDIQKAARISSCTHNYLRQPLLFMVSEGKIIVDGEKRDLYLQRKFMALKISIFPPWTSGLECSVHLSGEQKISSKIPLKPYQYPTESTI